MVSKNCYDYAINITYGIIIAIWSYFIFLTFMNIKHLYDNSITALLISVVIPPGILLIVLAGIGIVFIRVDTQISAINKISRYESLNVAETFEMINMFNE